jgi:Flp pilus assembly protein TadG
MSLLSRFARVSFRARSRGQALMEFALVIPIFLLLVVALFDLGRAVFAYNTLTNAAREGARMAIVNQYQPFIVARAKSQTQIVELDDPSVSVTFWQVGDDGNPDKSKPQCGDLSADHTVHQQHPVQERCDLHGDVAAIGGGELPTGSQCAHRRGGRRAMPETAMSIRALHRATSEVTMGRPSRRTRDRRIESGQIIVIAAMTMVALIGGVSLILEGGNAYAHQRVVQNAADSVANAGATVIAQRLGGGNQTDADVFNAIDTMAAANGLDTYAGYYTDVHGNLLTPLGVTTTDFAAAERVGGADAGDTSIPPGAQGVRVGGSQSFGTTFARVLGINQFTASADATAVAGGLTGGYVMPIVFPVSMTDCDGTGSNVDVDAPWRMSNPDPTDPTAHPIGQEFLVPLCKSGSGSFMILKLPPGDLDCEAEVTNPSSVQFNDFPVYVDTDTGNDCANKIQDGVVSAGLHGTLVNIPICDADCVTTSGSGGQYHIIRMTSFFLDFLSYSNGGTNPQCALTTSPNYGTSIVNIVGGNGSSSCMAGWFVRYITSGPVGTGNITNGEAIGVQLIR